MVVDQLGADSNVFELETWLCSKIGVGLGIQPGAEQINNLDGAFFPGAGFKKLLLASLYGPGL